MHYVWVQVCNVFYCTDAFKCRNVHISRNVVYMSNIEIYRNIFKYNVSTLPVIN